MSAPSEVILAQEQGATMRKGGRAKEIEAEFGIAETPGTLVLTNKRLIFACVDEKEDDLFSENPFNPSGVIRVIYSEVEDLGGVSREPPNVFVDIASTVTVKGKGGGIGRPSLEVEWEDEKGRHSLVFVEGVTKTKGKSLKDWAPIIEQLKAGNLRLVALPQQPPLDTIEGKISRVLSDMQERGVLAIEDAVETEFKVDLDPDEVQAACETLASTGLLKRHADSGGEMFYRKASPLGEEDLSS